MKPLAIILTIALCISALAKDFNHEDTEDSPVDGTPVQVIRNLAGICAVINRDASSGDVFIAEVLPDGAADKAGLKKGDRILRVDDATIEDTDLQQVASMLRGDPGTRVILTIARGNLPAPKNFTVVREEVHLEKNSEE